MLRREKDLLRETQSQSFDLIRRLEVHLSRLNEARSEDKRQIQTLERELSNCHQEIDYLQDQLNTRNVEVDRLEKRVGSLEIKLADVDLLEEEVVSLKEELNKSNSECEFLMQELETKETDLQESNSHIEKLEESISSSALEYQCEIESMRLDMQTMEQRWSEYKKSKEEASQEKARLNDLLHELETRFEDAEKTIKNLENENKQLKDTLVASEKYVKLFCLRVEEHFKIGKVENKLSSPGEVGTCGDILGPLLSKVLTLGASDANLKGRREKMPSQLHEYEELVTQLKKELKEEKLRAKDEAEDLAQEMAELRYQMTQLLEEERKRRSCIEQASLQRISELEAQLQMEQRKSVGPIVPFREARKPR